MLYEIYLTGGKLAHPLLTTSVVALAIMFEGLVSRMRVHLRSDSESRSGTVLQALGLVSDAGLTRVEIAVRTEAAREDQQRGS